jgi:hypothetical protein
MSSTAPQTPASDAETAIEAVRALAEELTKIVSVARALIEAGREIDLEGFQGQVGLLCAKSLDLPPDEGRRIRPRLIALSGSIEALSRAMAARGKPPL